ncbi:hypothetical protein [Paraglaciecola arctica]|uniref:hypothetical protein n=1 Tax=Paraglaciecola arctica TaxID=1128911 RepID=UPI001C078EE0|nr:hypothetical protein [Paraglaciecola arctica]MBU3002909.1 hypothetical protein [Paraglaciecola arctica]
MSNKKLFWIVFIILSCCEFGQIAYSKNSSVATNAVKSDTIKLQCDLEKLVDDCRIKEPTLASNSLPR